MFIPPLSLPLEPGLLREWGRFFSFWNIQVEEREGWGKDRESKNKQD